MPPFIQGLFIAIPFLLIVAAVSLYFSGRPDRQERVRRWLAGSVMSRTEGAGVADSSETVVYRPVDATSLDGQTTAAAASGMDERAADIDAANWPRFLTDDELVVFLASQRLRNGKYRSSANKIVAYLGGDRNHILQLVRQVREGVPEYRPLTDEQRETRAALGLAPNGHGHE